MRAGERLHRGLELGKGIPPLRNICNLKLTSSKILFIFSSDMLECKQKLKLQLLSVFSDGESGYMPCWCPGHPALVTSMVPSLGNWTAFT